MALRLLLLALAAVGALLAGAVLTQETPLSALRLWTAFAVLLLAPLLRPAVPVRTAAALAWPAAACLIGLLLPVALGGTAALIGAGPLAALLAAQLFASEALAVALAPLVGVRQAGPVMVLGLALLAALPVWAGPLAQSAGAQATAWLDAMLAASPLTHLAVAAGSDLLRTPWLYENTALGGLPLSDPALAALAPTYALLLAVALAAARRVLSASLSRSMETSS